MPSKLKKINVNYLNNIRIYKSNESVLIKLYYTNYTINRRRMDLFSFVIYRYGSFNFYTHFIPKVIEVSLKPYKHRRATWN